MPKYFDGEVSLPFEIVRLTSTEITPAALDAVFSTRDGATISVVFTGFEAGCLGYIINVRKQSVAFQIVNIAGETELVVTSTERLVDLIEHISGIRYVEEVQNVFYGSRNNIGSSMTYSY
ncbi:hypothetical protein QN362_04645 [Actimicrobium sp. CCC2.4]|uniref:hypothetical protein n=1 Tax=Actimicrobium sp. CCC2.4 TaxID=3048606 RepID=UPI002AC9C5D3|nr:hypothetical protein [Actimicrobium sp. CCC2.4]MEB0134616.1 hypothetical protein [Actimicrobium sp. CCC2.4]WPX34054.1 hypothetical protein RHM62_09725 [Actimicrobium sp. CCC2.4]